MAGNHLGYCDDHRRGGHRALSDHYGDSCGEPMRVDRFAVQAHVYKPDLDKLLIDIVRGHFISQQLHLTFDEAGLLAKTILRALDSNQDRSSSECLKK